MKLGETVYLGYGGWTLRREATCSCGNESCAEHTITIRRFLERFFAFGDRRVGLVKEVSPHVIVDSYDGMWGSAWQSFFTQARLEWEETVESLFREGSLQ